MNAPHRRPVERFLGTPEAAGGPFALLGLSPHACTDDLVLSALDRQIERIARHPQCDTPEADEVRLALHAAAAQLLDPTVRAHLIARWSGRAAAPEPTAAPAAAAIPAAPIEPAPLTDRTSAHKLLEHDAILTLGLFGGWNQRSLRRLLSIAHARGFDNAQVAATLRSLASTRRPVIARAAAAPAASSVPTLQPSAQPSAVSSSPASASPRPMPANDNTAGTPPQRAPSTPRSVGATGTKRTPPPPDEIEVEETDPLPGMLFRGGIYTLVALVSLGAFAALLYVITANDAPPKTLAKAPAPPPEVESDPAPPPREQPPEVEPPSPAPRALTAAQLPGEIAASAEALQVDAGAAAERLTAAIHSLSTNWTKLPPDQLIACHDGLVEFLYLAGDPDLAREILTIVASGSSAASDSSALGADAVVPAVWSAGMLSRLARENDLPLPSRLAIESQLARFFGASTPPIEHTFEAGASAALLKLPQRLIPPPALRDTATGTSENDAEPVRARTPDPDTESWKRWAAAAESFAASDRALRDRLLLAGLETLLIRGPEPNESRAAADIIADLAVRIGWREGDEARRWLLRAFADRLISNADLNAVTSTLATRSGAEGVDITMVLSTSAAERIRADLREQYAAAWSLADTISREQTTQMWMSNARSYIDQPYDATSEAQLIAHAALLARLNEAAHWQWRGQQEHAADIIHDLYVYAEQAMTLPAPAVSGASILKDSAWAQQYLAARQSIRARRDLLESLTTMGGTLGDVDAAVLVQEAVHGTPADIRQLAQTVVRRYARSPAIIKAMLDRLPRTPRIISNGRLVETVAGRGLPPVREETWPLEARRALVERLMEELAVRGASARIDRAADFLAFSYDAMTQNTPPAAGPGSPSHRAPAPGESTERLQRSAEQVWTMWRAAAEPLVPSVSPPLALSQIERRRAGRLLHAQGPIQRFAAQQVSICEVMAYIVACERPGRAEQVRETLATLAQARRRATHIFDQLIAVEAAIARLWIIRIGEEEPL